MDYGIFLKVVMILAGVAILLTDIVLLAKRKLHETMSIVWGFVALLVIIAGIVLHPSGWIDYMSETGLVLFLVIGFCVIYGLFFASCNISDILKKQNEMAMNISLLNQEIIELKKEIAERENNLEAGTK